MTQMLRTGWHLFQPILAGASLRDRFIGCVGAMIGITLTAMVYAKTFVPASCRWLVALIGASAVLMFAVPASPLAQPWSIIDRNVVSAFAPFSRCPFRAASVD